MTPNVTTPYLLKIFLNKNQELGMLKCEELGSGV
jgi:hypothetical protein